MSLTEEMYEAENKEIGDSYEICNRIWKGWHPPLKELRAECKKAGIRVEDVLDSLRTTLAKEWAPACYAVENLTNAVAIGDASRHYLEITEACFAFYNSEACSDLLKEGLTFPWATAAMRAGRSLGTPEQFVEAVRDGALLDHYAGKAAELAKAQRRLDKLSEIKRFIG